MSAAAARAGELIASVGAFRRRGLKPRHFRLNYSEGKTATLGIYDSKKGSVYAPFQVIDGARGSLLVEWSDGKVSRAAIDGNTGGDLTAVLEAAADSRYRDDEARAFAGKARIPKTPIFDPRVARIAGGRFEPLYDIIDLIEERGRRQRSRKISGSAVASIGLTVVATSRGLWYDAPLSDFRFGFSFDAELWDGKSSRRPFTLAAVGAVIDRAARLLPSLRKKDRGARSGKALVLCHPNFAEDLIDAYLLGNLQGAEVATGQSAFKAGDFRRRKQVFRQDLKVGVDPTVPYSSGSFRVTMEGLPARKETYIERGRLLQPIVGLKYSKRLKMRPTTPPGTMESVVLEAGPTLGYPGALRLLGDGFLLLSALGLHTQDTASGDYSLTAPQAIVVGGGRLRGSAKVVMAGNFFAALGDERTRLVRVPGYRFPGILMESHVTVG